jgi:hypothetical protein
MFCYLLDMNTESIATASQVGAAEACLTAALWLRQCAAASIAGVHTQQHCGTAWRPASQHSRPHRSVTGTLLYMFWGGGVVTCSFIACHSCLPDILLQTYHVQQGNHVNALALMQRMC